MMDESVEDLVERYRFGDCYAFAIAAARTHGLSIGALIVDVSNSGRKQVVHAYLHAEDGTWFDAGGVIDEQYLLDEYLSGTNRKRWTSYTIDECSSADEFLSVMDDLSEMSGEQELWLGCKPAIERKADEAIEALPRLPNIQHLLQAVPAMTP